MILAWSLGQIARRVRIVASAQLGRVTTKYTNFMEEFDLPGVTIYSHG